MSIYNKSLSPPEGTPYLETPDGLKYWLVRPRPAQGLLESVITEDPSISMHWYAPAGPGGPYDSYLFCYNGTRMGFITHPFDGEVPLIGKKPEPISVEDRLGCILIYAVGAPVYDRSYLYEKDEQTGALKTDRNGECIRKDRFGDNRPNPADMWVTGLNWRQFGQGKRDKFPSQAVQDEMIALWPFLCNGLISELKEISPNYRSRLPDGSPAWRQRMRFDESVLQQFDSGELIDD